MYNKNNDLKKNVLWMMVFLFLTACGKEESSKSEQKVTAQSKVVLENSDSTLKSNLDETLEKDLAKKVSSPVEEITWDNLIPEDYNPNEVIDQYLKEMEKLQDNDKEAVVLYGKIQAELDNAPVNKSMDGKMVKIPGFVAPLENINGVISEFLLVPYFGACIHSPPPPMNQTVMIKTGQKKGVKSENASLPVWITGELKAVEERTDIGAAGYRIENAIVEPYEEDI